VAEKVTVVVQNQQRRNWRMRSTTLQRLSLIIVVGLMLSGILACDFGGGAGAAKPRVTLESPPSAIELEAGQQVQIVCIVEDPKGVVSVELAVDGAHYATQDHPNPEGEPQWKFVETWAAKVDPGIHTLTITAYNVDRVASDPVSISVTVVEGAAPEATGAVTLATDTTVAPGTTATAPSPGTTETASAPAPTTTTGAPVPTRTTAAAPPPTNTPVPPRPPTNTPVPPQPPTNTPVPPPTSTAVPALPDLVIYAIYLDRDTVPYGETVHATVAVVNQGNAPAGPFRVSWDFGSGSGGQNVPCCLGPNQSYSLEWDSLPLYASYNTLAMADESQIVQESNEDNNRLARWVTVPPPMPDLAVAWAHQDESVHSGDQVYLEVCVKNRGNGAAGPFVVWWQYGSGDLDVCQWDIGGLGPGEETTRRCDVTIWYAYRTQGRIDPANSVQESNEDNNTFGWQISIW
jgi:hypothetical protein